MVTAGGDRRPPSVCTVSRGTDPLRGPAGAIDYVIAGRRFVTARRWRSSLRRGDTVVRTDVGEGTAAQDGRRRRNSSSRRRFSSGGGRSSGRDRSAATEIRSWLRKCAQPEHASRWLAISCRRSMGRASSRYSVRSSRTSLHARGIDDTAPPGLVFSDSISVADTRKRNVCAYGGTRSSCTARTALRRS